MKAMLSALFAGLFLIATASAFATESAQTGQNQIVADQDSGSQDSGSQDSGEKKSDN